MEALAGDAQNETRQYSAFISYATPDKPHALWLQRALERHKIPGNLRAGHGPAARLDPVFLDRSDLSATTSLPSALNEALTHSRALIVICSRAAVRSNWVNDEIRYFRALGRGDRIFCLIVDGEPGSPDKECFPSALVRDENGPLPPPLAADLRPGGDGKMRAKLKIISGMTGLNLDALVQRGKKRQRVMLGSAAAATLALAIAGSWSLITIAGKEREVGQMADLQTERTRRDFAQMEKFGDTLTLDRAIFEDILNSKRQDVEGLLALHPDDAALAHFMGKLLLAEARHEEKFSSLEVRESLIVDAISILEPLADGDRASPDIHYDLNDAALLYSQVLERSGRNKEALALLEQSRARALTNAADGPPSLEALLQHAALIARIGDIAEYDNEREAQNLFAQSVAVLDSYENQFGSDLGFQSTHGNHLRKLGGLLIRQSDQEKGRKYLERSIALLTRVQSAQPANMTASRQLAFALTALGRALHDSGDMEGSLSRLSSARETLERIMAVSPDDLAARKFHASVLASLGQNTLLSQEEREAALSQAVISYRETLALDPSNARAKHSLTVAMNLQANHYILNGSVERGMTILNEALVQSNELIKLAPDNMYWQGIKASTLTWLGYSNSLTGEHHKSAGFQQRAARVRTVILQRDPGNFSNLLSLTRNYRKLGFTHKRLGQPGRALVAAQSCQDMLFYPGGLHVLIAENYYRCALLEMDLLHQTDRTQALQHKWKSLSAGVHNGQDLDLSSVPGCLRADIRGLLAASTQEAPISNLVQGLQDIDRQPAFIDRLCFKALKDPV